MARMYRRGSSLVITVADEDVANLRAWGFLLLADGESPPPVPSRDDPYPQYLTPSEIASDAGLRATFGPSMLGDPNRKYRMVLGTIRNLGAANGYWQPISDAAHRPSGISSVATDGNEITVSYGWNGTMIGTFLAVPDETMAAEGYLMGSSVAANQCQIRLSRARRSIQDYIYWDTTLNAGAGGFRSGNSVFTVVSYTGGVLTLSHSSVIGSLQNNARLSTRGGAYRAVVSTSGAPLGETQTKIELWTAAGTLATVGHPDMKFYLERYDIGTGAVQVDPRSAITTATHPFHNIWLFGVMEVAAS